MKINKKLFTPLAFILGALLFTSSALADMALGSGYDELKNSAKATAQQMADELGNFTIDMLFSFQIDEQTIYQTTTLTKVDNQQGVFEENTSIEKADGSVSSHYYYLDKEMSISKDDSDATYLVTQFEDQREHEEWRAFENPFDQEITPEIEKIFDALVGSLKEQIQVEEKPDGGRLFSGSLSEIQVPPLINAVSSFLLKQALENERQLNKDDAIPQIESDIFIKKMSGQAVENKSGLLDHVIAEVILAGTDKDGKQHDLIYNVALKVTDVGQTNITKPDLSQAKVEKVGPGGFSSKYVGTYKNNIVIEEDGQFIKIGERTLEILNVDNGKVMGRYEEAVQPEYAEKHPEPYSFTFETETEGDFYSGEFQYTNPEGEQEYGQIFPEPYGAVYLELKIEKIDEHTYHSGLDHNRFNPYFIRVFDKE